MRYFLPDGRMLAITGTRREMASRSSRVSWTFARRAMARAWTMQLVEPPIAIWTIMAFSNAARVRICEGLRSSHTISTARRPEAAAMRLRLGAAGGAGVAPARARPAASATGGLGAARAIGLAWAGGRARPL